MAAGPEGSPERDLDCVTEGRRAAALLNPLRLRILKLAAEPISASELASRMALPRQRVNYHVRELAREGFLRRGERRRKRNMFEQRYIASARGYLLSPELLGAIGADWHSIPDTGSAEYLLALASQVQSDLTRAWKRASGRGNRISAFSLKTQFRFQSSGEREEFAKALRDAIVEVVAGHTKPYRRAGGEPGAGHPFRLVIGCYPYAAEPERGGSAEALMPRA